MNTQLNNQEQAPETTKNKGGRPAGPHAGKPFTRSSYQIPNENEPGLRKFLELLGNTGVTAFLNTCAEHPEEFGALIAPAFNKYIPARRGRSDKMAETAEKLKGKFTPQELQILLQQLKG